MPAPSQSYSIEFSALLSPVAGAVTAGYGLTKDAAGTSYVIATTANIAASKSGTIDGIALQSANQGENIAIQIDGRVDPSVTGLGTGIVENAVVDANGALKRASASAGVLVGTVNKEGAVFLYLPSGIAASTPAPTITSLNYTRGDIGGGGQSIVITGTNLSSASSVTFGGTSATITANTSTTVTVTLPAHASGTVDVAVTTPGGTVTSVSAFKYVDLAGLVNGWWRGPDYAVGTWTKKKGQNLTEATNPPAVGNGADQLGGFNTVKFDGTNDHLNDVVSTDITAYVSAGSGFGWALIYPTAGGASDDTTPYLNPGIWSDGPNAGAGFASLNVSTNGTNHLQMYIWDNNPGAKVVPLNITFSTWTLVLFKWDGTNLKARLGSGAWSSVACGNLFVTTFKLSAGENYNGSAFYTGKHAELALGNSIPSDGTITGDIIPAINQFWGTAF